MRQLRAAIALGVFAPVVLCAQRSEPRVQGVGSTAFVFGGTRIVAPQVGPRTVNHAGVRIDGGLECGRWAAGVGGRIWLLEIADTLRADGGDAFFTVARQVGATRRTALRGAMGIGWEELVFRREVESPNQDYSGPTATVGVDHEVPVRGHRLLISVDLVLPPTPPGNSGRRRPVLEVGVGFRGRGFPSLGPRFGFQATRRG